MAKKPTNKVSLLKFKRRFADFALMPKRTLRSMGRQAPITTVTYITRTATMKANFPILVPPKGKFLSVQLKDGSCSVYDNDSDLFCKLDDFIGDTGEHKLIDS